MTTRGLETLFGAVSVVRLAYGGREVGALHPLDAELNLPVERFSHGIRRRVAGEVARGSYDDAVAAIADTTGAHIAKRQVEQVARRAATDFDAFYGAAVFDEAVPGDLQIVSVDGKGIVTRTEDLRPATRRAAASYKQKMGKRLSKGEKPYRKRMATVAAVYGIDRFVRTPAQVVAGLNADDAGEARPRPASKRVFASLAKSVPAVIAEVLADRLPVATQRGCQPRRRPTGGQAQNDQSPANEPGIRAVADDKGQGTVLLDGQNDYHGVPPPGIGLLGCVATPQCPVGRFLPSSGG